MCFLGEIACFVLLDALQWYHPASNTCVLSLPALHRQEVVTDDRGSSCPEGIHFTPLSGGKTEVRRSFGTRGDPRNSYLWTTCQSLSAAPKEAISQCECYVGWSSCCQKTQSTWSTFCALRHTSFGNCVFLQKQKRIDLMCFTCSHFAASTLCDVMPVHLPRGIHWLPPLQPLQNNTPPRPLMRPPASCLYYEGCIPIERHERGDRLSLGDLWSPPRPKPSNAPLTESQIMGLINI